MVDETFEPQCKLCGMGYEAERLAIGYAVCMPCGDDLANKVVRTVAPINKSNYMMITDMAMLKQLNPKRTT
jgi:ribosomal protein L37AE/L43A